jgi:hypothetical protein
MEEGHARRDNEQRAVTWGQAGYYEQAFRVVGRYVDEQKPPTSSSSSRTARSSFGC